MKITIILLSICALLLFGFSCGGGSQDPIWTKPVPDPGPSPYEEEDRLTSWDSINQLIARPDNWERIVENIGLFQLGSSSLIEIWDSPHSEYKYHDRSYGTFPAIDGSTVLLPLAAEFAWQFLDLSGENTIEFFNFSTTHNAYMKLIGAHYDNNAYGQLTFFINETNGKKFYEVFNFGRQPDIIFATSPSAAELSIAQNKGVSIIVEPVCYDSFVFITHIENPVENLSKEQIRGIYSGRITNWSEIGGNNEGITAFQRNPGSGSQTAMEEMVMNGEMMMEAPSGWRIMAMGMLVEFVAEYQNNSSSIGYTYKYYIDRLYKNPNIKIIKVDGVEPSDENVKNKSYPFTAPYNGVIRSSDIDGVGGKFLDWMLSEEGQKVIAQAGYVPLAN